MPDVKAKRPGINPRQERAWDMYDRIPFIAAAYNYQADQVARVPFFPALIQPGDANPVPLQKIIDRDYDADDVVVPPGITTGLNDLSDELLRRCRSPEGGMPETRRQLTLNLRVPGECYAVWTDHDDQTTTCEIRSTDEIRHRGGDVWEVVSPGQKRGTPIDFERQAIARIWRRHPRYKNVADSAMLRLLDPCEEFLLLAGGNRALLSSRLANAGVLLVNSGISWGNLDETDDAEDPTAIGPFVDTLTAAMMQAIRNPSSADAVVPIVGEVEGDLDAAMRHVTFDRPMRDADLRRMAEIVVEIVRGMDVVPETVFGLGESANFATARVITAEAYNAYIDPLVLQEADALTTAWYRPGLLEAGFAPSLVDQLVFWRDPSSIIAQPDMAKNAKDLLTLGKLSDASGRKAMGFSESDAPTEEEMAAFQERNTRPAALPSGEEGPNSGDRELQASAMLAIETTSREVSGRQRRIDSLGRRLGEIDRTLMTRLQVACDHAVERTLRTVGARLRSAAQGNVAARPLLDGVNNLAVGEALGPGMLAVLGVDLDAEITTESFSDLAGDFEAWVGTAQRRASDSVLALSVEPWTDAERDELARQQDDDRRDGWAALALALVALARGRVFNPTSDVGPGEIEPTLSVPMGPIRNALSISGGSGGALPVAGEPPAGMIGTGRTIRDLVVSAVRAELTGWTWEWGGAAVPFPPHMDLDGLEFDSWTEDALANTSGEWPYGAYWVPGDHNGCTCSAPLRYREAQTLPVAASANALP
jgi:hypothetical protein